MDWLEANLVVVRGEHFSTRIQLNGPLFRIGRANDNEIVVNDKMASRVHAIIELTSQGHVVRDNGSSNGTYVNDERIASRVLRDFDELRIGTTWFQYRLGASLQDDVTRALPMPADSPVRQLLPEAPHTFPSAVPLRVASYFVMLLTIVVIVLCWPQKNSALPSIEQELPFKLFEAGYSPDRDPDSLRQALFRFTPKPGENWLFFNAWDVTETGETGVFVNGRHIGAVPPAKQGAWSGHAMLIPGETLILGEPNVLEFRSPNAYLNKDPWLVSKIEVTTRTDLPCDAELARLAFQAGQNLYAEREQRYRNLFDSIQLIALAIDLGKRCQPRPPFLATADALLNDATREFDKIIQEHQAAQNRFYKSGNKEAAERELQIIKAMVPERDHPYNISARNALVKMQAAKPGKEN